MRAFILLEFWTPPGAALCRKDKDGAVGEVRETDNKGTKRKRQKDKKRKEEKKKKRKGKRGTE